MSTPEILETSADDPGALSTGPRPYRRPMSDTWGLTRSGLETVIRLELRQRVRSTRWVLALVIWTVAIGALTALIWYTVQGAYEYVGDDVDRSGAAGRAMFGVTVFLVLGLGSLVAPALSATSVNGDRSAGVLATLQTTLLTPAEIVLGKLLAAWITSLALLVTAAPFILWAYFTGGTPFAWLLVTLTVLVLLLLVVCALGLGWSAITARTTSSAVLTYLTVAFFGLGLPLLFGLSIPLVTHDEKIPVLNQVQDPTDASGNTWTCEWSTQETSQAHTERTWWLLAPNPFVIVADAAPRPTVGRFTPDDDPLSAIRTAVREVRLGPPDEERWCGGDVYDNGRREAAAELNPTWPFGLTFDLGLAAAFTVVAVRRLRTPSRTLPRGVRVA